MKILVSDPIAADGIEILKNNAEVDVRTGLSQDQLLAIIGEYDGLAVRSETKVTAAVIEAGRKLQVIGRAGVGVDNIDLDAATARGIVVVNAPTGNIVTTAEHTLAMMLSLARHIPQAHASLKAGQWQRSKFTGIEVRNKALGIIGLGKVGTELARRAQGLEMRVLAHDPFVSADHAKTLNIELVSFDDLLKNSDFISVHTPLTSSTTHLIGREEIALMKPTVRLLNVARGGIIDEEALYEALENGTVAGAAIDVFSKEPANDNILIKSDKIIVTPHLGASTEEAQVNVAVDVAHQILAVLNSQTVRYAVNVPFVAPEALSFLTPFMGLAEKLGSLAMQLAEGQLKSISILYSGEITNYDSAPMKAAVVKGVLGPVSEENINLVNANIIAKRRGLNILEQKSGSPENYSNLITLTVITSLGETTVAGTLLRGEPHIVQVDGYWVDVVPSGSYLLFSDHQDRPGVIGAVGTLLGNADINISFMQVGRLKPRGRAMMVLGLDEPIPPEHKKQILDLPDIDSARLVKL